MWARVQPMGAGPDEQMRYQIADYIYKHGSLPVGDDPSVRNVVWEFLMHFLRFCLI